MRKIKITGEKVECPKQKKKVKTAECAKCGYLSDKYGYYVFCKFN